MRRNTVFHALGNIYFPSLYLLSSCLGAVIQLIHPEPFEKSNTFCLKSMKYDNYYGRRTWDSI